MCVLLSGGVSYAASGQKEASKAGEVPQAAPLTLSGAYGGWTYRCAFSGDHPASGPESCIVQQTLMTRNAQGMSPVGMVILAKSENATHKNGLSSRPWRLTVMAPLALSLKKQPKVLIDNGHDSIALEWQSCVVTGCLASADLKPAQALLLSEGTHQAAFVAEKVVKGNLTIDFSLNGADKSMKKIDQWISHSPVK